jgi:hypothetical protein
VSTNENEVQAILAAGRSVLGGDHAVASAGEIAFTWDYDRSRSGLSKLYEKAKTSQWNGATDLPWDTDVDQERMAAAMTVTPATTRFKELAASYGSEVARWTDAEWTEFGIQQQNAMLSNFLHGEQGALICTAKLVEQVPWIDAKYYGATQVIDEARHVEVFARYLNEKMSGEHPINPHLGRLLDAIITDERWDITYLGMQIMVEGLALAAFGFIHSITDEPLLKQLLRYVMSDEARHVAFGVLSLQELYDSMTASELRVPHRHLGADGGRPGADRPGDARRALRRGASLPDDAVLQDRPQLPEARAAGLRRRLAPGPLHRARHHRVRALGRHQRRVRVARRDRRRPGRSRVTGVAERISVR